MSRNIALLRKKIPEVPFSTAEEFSCSPGNFYLKQKNMVKIKTALVGYGPGGRIYNAPIVSCVEGFQVNKILSSSPDNVAAAHRDYPESDVVSDFSEIIKDKNVQLLIISLPNHLHFEFAKRGLEAGKHVVVEKPITPDSRKADQLISLAKEKNVVLSVNHNRRWDSDFRTIYKLVKEQKLGRIVEYEAHFDRFRNEVKEGWKERKEIPGSGILYDLGSHLIDQALSLFGLPVEVFADIRIQRDSAEVPDNFELLLFYPGLKVTLKAGMLVKEKGPTYSINGTKGSFIKYGADVQEEALKQGHSPKNIDDWGVEPKEIWGKLNSLDEEKKIESERGDYRQVYMGVYEAILNGTKASVTAEQARDVIRVIELAQKSNSKKCVVKFN